VLLLCRGCGHGVLLSYPHAYVLPPVLHSYLWPSALPVPFIPPPCHTHTRMQRPNYRACTACC
jgi:hypothetical protein